MKLRLSVLSLFCLILCISSCKKKSNDTQPETPAIKRIDTLKPLSYYPVYPGSHWDYLNEKNATVRIWTQDTYQKHCIAVGFTDTVYVPYVIDNWYNKNAYPVYQYDLVMQFLPYNPDYPMYRRSPWISEVTGYSFRRGGIDSRYPDFRPVVKVLGKFIKNNDSVLILKITESYQPRISYEHYTRNIGLSWQFTLDTLSGDTLSSFKLVNYHINRR